MKRHILFSNIILSNSNVSTKLSKYIPSAFLDLCSRNSSYFLINTLFRFEKKTKLRHLIDK